MDLARGTAAAEGRPARPDNIDGASLCLQPRMLRDLSVPGNSKLSMKLRNLLSNQPLRTEGWGVCGGIPAVLVLPQCLHPQGVRRGARGGCLRAAVALDLDVLEGVSVRGREGDSQHLR